MLVWFKNWQRTGYNPTLVKQTSEHTEKNFLKFLEPTRKPKVIYNDNFFWNLASLARNHLEISVRQHDTDQKKHGTAERSIRRVKEGTSAVLLQSGLGDEWWADSVECYCHLQNIQDLLSGEKTPHERRFGMPFNGAVLPFRAMVEYHPISAKDQSFLHQFRSNVLPGMFLGYASYAEGIWKGDIVVADTEEVEEMDASELHASRLNAKEVSTLMKGDNFTLPVADGTRPPWSGIVRTRRGTRNSSRRIRRTLFSNPTSRWQKWFLVYHKEVETSFFPVADGTVKILAASGKFHLHPGSSGTRRRTRNSSRKVRWIRFSNPTSRRLDAGWWASWRWLLDDHRSIHSSSSRCTPSQTVRAERRDMTYSDEVLCRYQNNIHATRRNVGEKYWKLLERGWRLHKICSTEGKATGRIYMVRGETYKETNDLSPRQCMSRYLDAYVWCSKEESKTKMGCRETKARQCQTIKRNSFMNQTMKNSSSASKPLAESWKFRCQQQCLAKCR